MPRAFADHRLCKEHVSQTENTSKNNPPPREHFPHGFPLTSFYSFLWENLSNQFPLRHLHGKTEIKNFPPRENFFPAPGKVKTGLSEKFMNILLLCDLDPLMRMV